MKTRLLILASILLTVGCGGTTTTHQGARNPSDIMKEEAKEVKDALDKWLYDVKHGLGPNREVFDTLALDHPRINALRSWEVLWVKTRVSQREVGDYAYKGDKDVTVVNTATALVRMDYSDERGHHVTNDVTVGLRSLHDDADRDVKYRWKVYRLSGLIESGEK